MIRNLSDINNAVKSGHPNILWARGAAAALLGLPIEAIWIYSPWAHANAARSDKRLRSLRQEWIDYKNYEFHNNKLLLEGLTPEQT